MCSLNFADWTAARGICELKSVGESEYETFWGISNHSEAGHQSICGNVSGLVW